MSVHPIEAFVESTRIASLTKSDPYAARGVSLSRDASHRIIGALRRDAYEMRTRGGDANFRGAQIQDEIALNISKALSES
jgi:hypothetical protein